MGHAAAHINITVGHYPGRYEDIGMFADKHGISVYDIIAINKYAYQNLDQFNTKQCVEVLTTGPITTVNCHLPAHCGSVEYTKTTSSWFSEVGVCIGMGEVPIIFHSQNKQVIAKNHYEVYYPTLEAKGNKQHLNRHFKHRHHLTLPNKQINAKAITPTQITMILLHNPVNNNWFIYSMELMWSFPLYNDVYAAVHPRFKTLQTKVCIPTITNNNIPIFMGPYNRTEALRKSILLQSHNGATDLRMILDYDNYIDGHGVVRQNNNKYQVVCNPTIMTSSLIPISISSVISTVGHCVLVVASTLWILIYEALMYICSLLTQIINPVVLFMSIIINVYKYKLSLIDSVVISIIISLVTTIVKESLN